jgi:hypothetical protein
MLIRQHVHPFPMQGLPLKAVYRDSLVGIRYLPIQARSNSPSVVFFMIIIAYLLTSRRNSA